MTYGPLFDQIQEEAKSKTRAQEMFEQFKEYHRENPQVYGLFSKYAFKAVYSGREQYSSRSIIERIRWHAEIETRADDGLKINSNHTPFYARLWEKKNPLHDGFFKKRKLISQDKAATGATNAVNFQQAEDEDWLDRELKALVNS